MLRIGEMDSGGCAGIPSFLKTSLSISKLAQNTSEYLEGLFKLRLLDLTFRVIDLVGLG